VAEPGEKITQQRQAESDHIVMVALDPRHERASHPVDGEGSRHLERLPGLDVGRDLLVRHVREVDHGGPDGTHLAAGAGVAQTVPRVQDPAAPAHRLPSADRGVAVARLPERFAVELEHRVASEYETSPAYLVGDRGTLELGETQGEIGRSEPAHPGFVDARDDDRRLDARCLEGRQAGGGGRGEHERDHRASLAEPVPRLEDGPLPFVGVPGSRISHGGSPSIHQPDYWWYRARSDMLRAVLGPYVDPVRRLLDVGSADGPSVGWLTAPEKISLDLDARGLQAPRGVCGSLLALPFADGTFDVVSAFDVLEHSDPEQVALAELRRVLAPAGRLLMSVPAYPWAWSDHDVANGHHRRYTRSGAVASVEAAGFEVLRATYGFAAVFPAFAAERALRLVQQRLGRERRLPADSLDLPPVSSTVERALIGLCRVDERLLAHRDLPFGSSVFLAASVR
jgi:SAM-dependent methyltransferase